MIIITVGILILPVIAVDTYTAVAIMTLTRTVNLMILCIDECHSEFKILCEVKMSLISLIFLV